MNLNENETIITDKKSFLNSILVHTLKESPIGKCLSKKRVNKIGIDDFHLKCNFFAGNVLTRSRDPMLCNLGLIEPPGHILVD